MEIKPPTPSQIVFAWKTGQATAPEAIEALQRSGLYADVLMAAFAKALGIPL